MGDCSQLHVTAAVRANVRGLVGIAVGNANQELHWYIRGKDFCRSGPFSWGTVYGRMFSKLAETISSSPPSPPAHGDKVPPPNVANADGCRHFHQKVTPLPGVAT